MELTVTKDYKAEPMLKALTCPATTEVPTSILRGLSHLTVIADQEAASLLLESEQSRAG